MTKQTAPSLSFSRSSPASRFAVAGDFEASPRLQSDRVKKKKKKRESVCNPTGELLQVSGRGDVGDVQADQKRDDPMVEPPVQRAAPHTRELPEPSHMETGEPGLTAGLVN